MPQEAQYAQTATNPKTGERVGLLNGKWVPIPKTPSAGAKVWEAANKPPGKDIAEKMRWAISDMSSKLPEGARGPAAFAGNLLTAIPVSVTESGRRMTTPMGVATLGLGGLLQRLRELTTVPKNLKTLVGAGETATGLGFGAVGAKQAMTSRKGENTLEKIERIGTGTGQAMLGVSALGHVAGPSVKEGVRTGTREVLGVGDKTVARHASEAAKEVSERQAKFEKAKTERAESIAEQKAGYEARKAKKLAEDEAKEAEAKTKHTEAHDTAEKKLAASTAKEASARWYNERLNRAKAKLTQYRDALVKRTSENLDKAEKAERGSLDSRWERFNKMVSSLKGNLSKVGQSVLDAEKLDIKGSKENIKVFRDVLGRLKENMIQSEDGSIKFIDDQMVGLDQMRGYWQELGDAIYGKDLPYDVRQALQRVRDGVDAEIQASVLDNFGKQAGGELLNQYGKLKEDWAGYKRTWDDRRSGSPLSAIKRSLRAPVAIHEGVDKSGVIADMLSRPNVEGQVKKLLESRGQFGADPQLVYRLNAVSRKLKALPKQFEAVVPAKGANFPKYEAPKTSEIEPFKAKGKDPEAPEVKEFSPEEFRREKILSKAEKLSDLTGWDILAMAEGGREAVTGHAPWALAYPVGKRVASQVLQIPSVLDWLSGESPKTSPSAPPSKPGPMGGINAQGYETSMRPSSKGDLVQALHTEQQELLTRAKTAPHGPQRDMLMKRIAENFKLILEMEGGAR